MTSQFDEPSGQCAVCGKPVSQDDGYVRRAHGDETVALCCASSVAAFVKDADGTVRRQKTQREVRQMYQLLRPSPLPEANHKMNPHEEN
jgi:hypothetical protein